MCKPVVFGTLNALGLTSKKEQYRLSHLVVEKQPDVFAIQETKMRHDKEIEQVLALFCPHRKCALVLLLEHQKDASCFF